MEVIEPWWKLYDKQRRHFVVVCSRAIAAGVAERQVQLAESQGLLMAKMLRGVLTRLGVDMEAPETVEAIRHHLAEARETEH